MESATFRRQYWQMCSCLSNTSRRTASGMYLVNRVATFRKSFTTSSRSASSLQYLQMNSSCILSTAYIRRQHSQVSDTYITLSPVVPGLVTTTSRHRAVLSYGDQAVLAGVVFTSYYQEFRQYCKRLPNETYILCHCLMVSLMDTTFKEIPIVIGYHMGLNNDTILLTIPRGICLNFIRMRTPAHARGKRISKKTSHHLLTTHKIGGIVTVCKAY